MCVGVCVCVCVMKVKMVLSRQSLVINILNSAWFINGSINSSCDASRKRRRGTKKKKSRLGFFFPSVLYIEHIFFSCDSFRRKKKINAGLSTTVEWRSTNVVIKVACDCALNCQELQSKTWSDMNKLRCWHAAFCVCYVTLFLRRERKKRTKGKNAHKIPFFCFFSLVVAVGFIYFGQNDDNKKLRIFLVFIFFVRLVLFSSTVTSSSHTSAHISSNVHP